MLIREDILGDDRGEWRNGQRTSCGTNENRGDSQELAESGASTSGEDNEEDGEDRSKS